MWRGDPSDRGDGLPLFLPDGGLSLDNIEDLESVVLAHASSVSTDITNVGDECNDCLSLP